MIVTGRTWRRVPAPTWGTAAAHAGIAVMTLGVTASGALSEERLANLAPGGTMTAGGFVARLDGVEPVAGPNYTALRGIISVTSPTVSATLFPERRSFANPMNETTETDILPLWSGNLYAVLGKGDGTGRWQVRLHWQPLVALIWIGGLLAAAGAMVSMLGTRRR
jgi:cytochrome c-type biogenesis protein CcmF